MSRAWRITLRAFYRLLTWNAPLIRAWWRAFGLGITVDLEVRGRRSGRPRRVLLGLLSIGDRWYVGHPNGPVDWTRNLDAAGGRARLFTSGNATPIEVRAVRLEPGAERSAAIGVTWQQQPFPGNVVYRLARRHVLAAGVYYRLETVSGAAGALP